MSSVNKSQTNIEAHVLLLLHKGEDGALKDICSDNINFHFVSSFFAFLITHRHMKMWLSGSNYRSTSHLCNYESAEREKFGEERKDYSLRPHKLRDPSLSLLRAAPLSLLFKPHLSFVDFFDVFSGKMVKTVLLEDSIVYDTIWFLMPHFWIILLSHTSSEEQ